ncbi:MAG: hypothetical protein NTU73_12880 [Ignavibacteriae bacterium]|nr:hypothetical protein [Ignavibacteriota bacterium]
MQNKYIIIIVFFIFKFSILLQNSFADSTNVSFQSLNKNKNYTSISFGMGAMYGNNPSLKNFIQYKIPDYSRLTRDAQLSEFYTGLDFFGGVERQITKKFSIKGEYSYFLKSYNVKFYSQYDFSYYSHQPCLMFFYVIPQEYSYLKIGAGTGYIYSKLSVREYGTENSYTSNGFGFKTELILNAQIGKSFASYISGYLSKTFLSNLKDNNGKELLTNGTNETVNLSSLGAGIRLGVEIFIF